MNDRSVTFVEATTVSVCEAVLLFGFGSVCTALTFAVFVIDPACSGIVMIWIVAVAPLASEPSWQLTVPPASEHEPCVVVDV